jgi:enoyl-CoA hydratase/carnithine racemase
MTSTLTDAPVLRERRGSALWLRLNRPEVFNGLNQDVLDGLVTGLDAAEAEPGVRAVVLTAAGRAFCAGADLGYARSLAAAPAPAGTASAGNAFLHRVRSVFDRIESFGKPVIAAVNGVAVGGGLELLLVCDLAIAARTAKLGDGHAVYGQVPGGGASVRLVRRLGLATAKHLMFTGELHPAERYLGTDLLIDVVDPDELVPAVDRLVETIASRSPIGLAAMKKLANDAHDTPLPAALARELEVSALHERSADWQEGISAFADKRTPDFPGRQEHP